MGIAAGGVIPGYAADDDRVPVMLAGCGYLLPAAMVADLIALLPPIPPAHP